MATVAGALCQRAVWDEPKRSQRADPCETLVVAVVVDEWHGRPLRGRDRLDSVLLLSQPLPAVGLDLGGGSVDIAQHVKAVQHAPLTLDTRNLKRPQIDIKLWCAT